MKEEVEKVMPEEKISILIEGDQMSVELPSVGGFIDIEKRKIQLSGGNHSHMLSTLTKSSVFSYTSIEMIATMEVLLPKLKKRLRVDALTELKPHQIKDLLKEYSDKIFPWLEEWRDFINAKEDSDNEESSN